MILTRGIYCILIIMLLGSCAKIKSLTSRDNSTTGTSQSRSKKRDVRFLDNISVTPGQTVTSRHAGAGTSMSMASAARRKEERDAYNARLRTSINAKDIEKADWLQLKYAIVLDETVENLTNVNLLTLIDDWWGTGYCMGGSSKDCIDCSAFTTVVMRNIYNVTIPRTAQEQYTSSQHIKLEELNEGDLVFFHTGGREISHVGVYLLNNKFVHAATSGGVMVSDLNDNYWKGRFKGAGRYISQNTAQK